MFHNRLRTVATVSSIVVCLWLKDPVLSPAIPGLSIKMDEFCILHYSKCNFYLNVTTVTQHLTVILSPHF